MAGAAAKHGVEAECDEPRQQSEEYHIEKLETLHFWTCACSALRNRNSKIDVPRIAQEIEPNPCRFAGPAYEANFTKSSPKYDASKPSARGDRPATLSRLRNPC
jgi:hypothetical protein